MFIPEDMQFCLNRLREAEQLPPEQVFDALSKLLLSATTEDLLLHAPLLAAAIPELKPMIGFDQRSPHHAYDLYKHTAGVTGSVPRDLTQRWAALLHDTGKIPTFTLDENGRGHFYGHAKFSAEISDRILRRLNAPARLREDAVQLIELHMYRFAEDKQELRRWLNRLGSETMDQLLTLQEADLSSKGTGKEWEMSQFSRLRQLIREIEEASR